MQNRQFFFSVSPQCRSPFPTLLQTFCLTACSYLNTQKQDCFAVLASRHVWCLWQWTMFPHLCEFWQSNDLFALVSWKNNETANVVFLSLSIQYCKRKHSSCVAFSVFHEYFTSNLSAFSAVISCVNLYPQFPGLTRQALTKESNLNVV